MELLRRFSFTLLLITLTTLVACGGGDGGLTGNGSESEPDAITLSISKSDGDLAAANDVTVSVTVMQGSQLQSGKLVTFLLTDNTVANFSPEIGTAVTNSSGVATILVKATSIAGGVEVTASYSTATPVAIAFNSVGDGVSGDDASIDFQVAAVTLFASSQQLASSGAQAIELIAIAKDANNNLLEGATINFGATSGAVEVNNVLTGADGKASAKLTTGFEKDNRVITVTANSITGITDVVDIQVVGTTITLTGSSSLAINDASSYIIKMLDSDGNGIANTSVVLSLSNLSTEVPAANVATLTLSDSIITDNTGQAAVTVTGTTGGTNSIIATALGVNVSKAIAVQADSFLFTNFSDGINNVEPSAVPAPTIPDVLLSKIATLNLTWLRSGVPITDGTVVNFTTTRGTLTVNSVTTIAGEVTATLTSTDAGKALVTFVGSDTVNGKLIELTNQLEFEFVADSAATIKAQASPQSIGPDGQTSTISVVVKDANGNLVKNKTIDFELSDTNGGAIFPASAVTDSNGSASTVYTSNSTSAQNGVVITAIVNETPAVNDMVSLTVADRELFISLGTGNKLEELGTTDYIKEYSVFVTDADSNPVANKELTISAIPHKYYKGFWVQVYDGDEFITWAAIGADNLERIRTLGLFKKQCDNEDVNFDGVLDLGEDFNNDGELTPGNIAAAEGTIITDDNGRAVVKITYPQSYGEWLDVKLIAEVKVNGTESSAQTIFTLPVLADHVLDEDLTPPTQGIGTRGPFGLLNDCSLNVADDPKLDGT